MTTPAHIAPAPETAASLGRRVGAFLIDMVPLVLIGIVTGIVTLVISMGTITTEQEVAAAVAKAAVIQTVAGVLVVVWWIVLSILQGGGGSVGQRMCGIRLVRVDDGGALRFGRSLLRNVVFVAACAIVVGYFTPLFDGLRHRGWHDKASGSMMIDSAAVAAAAAPAPRIAAPVANSFVAPPAGATFDGPLTAATPPAPTSFAPAAPLARPAAPAMAVVDHGMISAVPGVSQPDDAVDAVDETRTKISQTRPAAIVTLTWDDGTPTSVHGRTLFGRNPQHEAGAALMAVRDETLSLSKTHFVVDADADGVFVTDLHSTNGTSLVRAGVREKLAPDVRVGLRPGDRLEFGDRTAAVGMP